MNNYFDQEFFERPVLKVAEELIGQDLVKDGKRYRINEIEAYDGPKDLACHASKGLTARTKVLYGPPGHFYVYLCYGIHWLLNITTCSEGYPAGILIRGIGELNGPGRLTKLLKINKSYNAKPATPQTGLYFAPLTTTTRKPRYHRTPRIGVDYAGPVWSKKPYRFVLPAT